MKRFKSIHIWLYLIFSFISQIQADLVEIENGRKIFFECTGNGFPTVIFISGRTDRGEIWDKASVLSKVSKFTHACVYDRPGAVTIIGDNVRATQSTSVTQPITPKMGVEDLHALLKAANIPGPYVLVSHSYGGLIARLYASTYPDEVAGLVLIDILSETLIEQLTPEQQNLWIRLNSHYSTELDQYTTQEKIDFVKSFQQMRDAPTFHHIPVVILTSDQTYHFKALIAQGVLPADTPLDFEHTVFQAHLKGQQLLTKRLQAKQISNTHAGHYIQLEQPQLVVDSIRNVVEQVRDKKNDKTINAIELNLIEKKIQVNGRESTVLAITQPDGTLGVRIKMAQQFDVRLHNRLNVPSSIHWHGLILPNDQDGVAFITQYPLYPTQSYHYRFPLVQSGTFWMHSHFGFQEQRLLTAPLIILDSEEAKLSDQEVVMLLGDFSFKSPTEIYQKLRCKQNIHQMKMNAPDIVDVDYDAYLTNLRTLNSPEIIEVQPGTKIRLRIINGASATNFFILLGNLLGEAIAVDGNRIKSFTNSHFELADAQRIDILVKIPEEGGAFPILAQAEGTDRQTGLILSTKNATIPELSEKASQKLGALTNDQERQLQALHPLPLKKVDKQLIVELGGEMMSYEWSINGHYYPEFVPLVVEKGQRVEMVFKNKTMMSHPMHLHGHVFQVTSIDGKAFDGALRDTILVTPNSTLAIQFDANNPGVWPLHCHILYHMEGGMFTILRYSDFQQPLLVD